ncbi:MAG TPA: hypothetical protein VI485_07010 [Vicinamibacterales bacterium]|nr:hypothetical protein [Vicinamibacterales bacterium]
MKSSIARATLLATAVIVSPVPVVDRSAHAEQKPVQERETIIEAMVPPESLSEMVRVVDAVILATFTGKGQFIEPSTPYGIEFTNYVFVVDEIMKPDALVGVVGDELTVRMIGGEKEFATHIRRTRVAGVDPLLQGRKYVMFLRRHPTKNSVDLAWGPNSVYDVTQGTVRPIERELKRRDGAPAAAFIEALRVAAAQ